ncbi:MAG: hypothetical protein RL265_1117 [Bacteroidota bacterium]
MIGLIGVSGQFGIKKTSNFFFYQAVLLFTLFFLLGCTQKKACKACEKENKSSSAQKEQKDKGVDKKDLKSSVYLIEKKYGEQWDFCACVLKGDSVNKAILKPNLSDKQLQKVLSRFEFINKKCQSFKIQDASRSPEQRERHEKKVKECLGSIK